MTVAIIGIGLIGGSLALAMRECSFCERIVGIDSNALHRSKALSLGLVDEAFDSLEHVADAQLIIIATPVDTIMQLLPSILNKISAAQTVMDVGSTKSSIMNIARRHPMGNRFVGAHPMAGTEYSGPDAAIPDLFKRKCTVIVDQAASDQDAVNLVVDLFSALEMTIVFHDSQDHDLHTAYISHISHISSFALALTVLEKEQNDDRIFELAGGGFASTVRLAKSNPDTWVPIFEQNRDAVLDVLDEHINSISKFRTLLIKRDFQSFRELIQKANQIKRILN